MKACSSLFFSSLFVSSMTVAAVILAAPQSRAQSVTNKVSSAVSNTAEKGKTAVSETADKTANFIKGAPAGTSADILSRIHEVDETEIYAGELAAKKGSTPEVQSYGKELVKDHSNVERKVEALAKDEGIQLSPPAPESEQLERIRNHDGAVQEMLANLSGSAFDRDFLHAMVEDHQKNIDELKEVQKTTSDQKLRGLIQELLPQLTDHQEMGEKLLEKAKKTSS